MESVQGKYATSESVPVNVLEEKAIEYNSDRDFTTWDAWKKARRVKLFFYNSILPKLPKQETYQLGAQIRNAGVSCTANIAEGSGRYYFQEGVQFYRISRSSLYELKDHLIACLDLDYIDKQLFDKGHSLIEDTKITLNGFIKYVINQKKQARNK